MLGSYLKLDNGGKLTIDVSSLKTALSYGNSNSLYATWDVVDAVKADVRTLKSVINDDEIQRKI
jgi:hypothetical protein